LLFGALVGSSIYNIPVITGLVTLRVLRNFGKYSYGIYVYHVPVYFAVHAVLVRAGLRFPLPLPYSIVVTGVSVAICFFVARMSYGFYEARFLKLKNHFEPEYPLGDAQPASTSYTARS
jgi:peptidoglycan/LPS O-acetylase OafA/YrhL